MRLERLHLLVLAGALLGCATARPGSPAPPAPVAFSVTRTVTLRRAPGAHLAFPDVARLRDGRLLVVYREGAGHAEPTGRIAAQVGSADASTWEPARTLVDTPDDDRDPSLAALSDGSLGLAFFPYRAAAPGGGRLALHQVVFGRSADDGATFSFAPVTGGPSSPDGASEGPDGRWLDGSGRPLLVWGVSSAPLEVDGRLVVPAYGGEAWNPRNAASPRSRIVLYESADGLAWSARPVRPEAEPGTWLEEPALLRLADGRLLLHVRASRSASPGGLASSLQSTSADGGRTWSDWRDLGYVGHAPELLQLSDGTVIAAVRRVHADALGRASRCSVHLEASRDGGATWGSPFTVRDCGGDECGYPALLELGDGRLLVVYYFVDGAAASIEAAVLAVSAP